MSNDSSRVDVKHLNNNRSSSRRHHRWSSGKKHFFGRSHSSSTAKKKPCKMSSRGSEYFPLMSDDYDATDDEDEEVTVHDSSIFRLRQRNSPNRRLPEPSQSNANNNNNNSSDGVASDSAKIGANGFKSDFNNSKADPFLNREMITVKMKDGDTLQSVSLKYRCSISDIKRANNLISDQDFYALPHLKVPVRKHGILSQPVSPGKSSNHLEEEGNNNARVIDLGMMLSNNSPQDAAEFLKRMDEDLVKIVLSTKSQNDQLDVAEASAATSSPLGGLSLQPALVKDPHTNPYVLCNIHWSYVLFFMVIISIVSVVVIFYINYVRTSHNSTQQNQVFSGGGGDHFSSSQKAIGGS